MKIHEKYLEALKTFNDYVIVSDWAIRFGEMFPEELQKANEQALNQKNETTGIREIAARISSNIAGGKWKNEIAIDKSERPKKIKYISKEEAQDNATKDIEEDLEPLKRQDIINNATNELEIYELYRMTEFENIQKSFKQFFGLDFEIDHAEALLNDKKQGAHHPENLQLLLKYHNGKKNKNSWQRFTFKEQENYIKKSIEVHSLVAHKLDLEIDNKILDSLILRLKEVF